MDAKLLYLNILTILAFLFASCSSEEPREGAGKGAEVTFEVDNGSRAAVTSDINTLGSRFAVFGDRTHVESQSGPVAIFNKTIVEYKNEGWCYEGTQYWFPGHEHSFVAIYPLSALDADDLLYADSRLSFSYQMPLSGGNSVKQEDVSDIITATHRRLHKDGDAVTPISFRFTHLLSLINLYPALDDNYMDEGEYFLFHKLEFSGFKSKGKFSIVPAQRQSNNQTSDYVVEVSDQKEEGALAVTFSEPVKVSNDRVNKPLFDAKDAIIMIPQSFASDSEAKIILTYSINNNPEIKYITLPLKGKNLETGKSYNLKFTISRTGLLFESMDIKNWEVVSAGNVNAR